MAVLEEMDEGPVVPLMDIPEGYEIREWNDSDGLEKLPPGALPLEQHRLQYSNGDHYVGECVGTIRHGKGRHVCKNGDVYEGDWSNNRRSGHGRMVFAAGLFYEGQWKTDMANGEGKCRYANGDRYIGEWKDDLRWGWGLMEFSSGDQYEGQFFQNMIEGKGRLSYKDGSYIEGDFGNNDPLKGKYVSADGKREYVGCFGKGGKRHGHGSYMEVGAYKYVGDWKDDCRHGKGKCIAFEGWDYHGQWANDQFHGEGTWVSKEETYEGTFLHCLREGNGVCKYGSGEMYKGEFAKGLRSGKGACVSANGDRYEGEWKFDKHDGQGVCFFANGDKYSGWWEAGRRNGYGLCIFKDGTKFRGYWNDDKWQQAGADPCNSRVFGPGIARAVAGQETWFGIEARDVSKNKMLKGGDSFAGQLVQQVPESGASERVPVNVKDHNDGTYSGYFTLTNAGLYQLEVVLGVNEHVSDSPFPIRVEPGPACAKNCKVVGAGRSEAIGKEPTEFVIESYDAHNNKVVKGGEVFEATLSGPSGQRLGVEVRDRGGGSYVGKYRVAVAGFWRLEVLLAGKTVGSSPYSLQVWPAAGHPKPTGKEKEYKDIYLCGMKSVGCGSAEDVYSKWQAIAKAEFGDDFDGWESEEEQMTSEEKYIRDHPDVPVIRTVEDLHALQKREQAKKEQERATKIKRLQAVKRRLQEQEDTAERQEKELAKMEQPAGSCIQALD